MKYRIVNFHRENIFEVSFSSSAQTFTRIEDISNLSKEEGMALCSLIGSFFDFMPGHVRGRHLHQLPHWIWKRVDCHPRELTFYGGSFHPWHDGHEACLTLFPKPESLLVVPDNNPWKSEKRDFCHWTFFKNLALDHLAMNISFFPGFLGTEEKNPTSNWILSTRVKKKSLLLGEDTFQGLSKWIGVDRILPVIEKIYVVPRALDNFTFQESIKFIAIKAPHIKIEKLPNHQFENVSSSKIRASQM